MFLVAFGGIFLVESNSSEGRSQDSIECQIAMFETLHILFGWFVLLLLQTDVVLVKPDKSPFLLVKSAFLLAKSC